MKQLFETKIGLMFCITLFFSTISNGQDSVQYTYHGLSFGSFNDNEHGYFNIPADTITESYQTDFFSWSMGYNFEIQRSNKFSLVAGCDAVSQSESQLYSDSTTVKTRLNGYHVWLKARYYYLQQKRFQLFSGLGVGFTSLNGVQTRTALSGSSVAYHLKTTYQGVYAELLGARMRVGKNFGLFMSLNTNPIPFRLGFTYRIPFTVSSRRLSSLIAREELKSNTYAKSTNVIGLHFGRMYSNDGGFSPLSFNFTLEHFVKENLSSGLFVHYSNGIYFLDDFVGLSNGLGTIKLLKNKYAEHQLTNLQISYRITKYKPLGEKWKFFYGGGVGIRARFLPGFNSTYSGSSFFPFALNGYYGFQYRMDNSLSLSIQSGFIPNLLQLGFTYSL